MTNYPTPTEPEAGETIGRRIIRSAVDWSGAGLPLDAYLAGRFTYRSLEAWRDRIRQGEIQLNGTIPDPGAILALHDRIEYFPGDLPEPEAELHYRVAWEDEFLLVIDKPGNLCMHPSGPFFRHTLWHLLNRDYGSIHLVNRLDRETSGLLIAAKDAATAAKLAKPKIPIRKEYIAMVHGEFNEPVSAFGFLHRDVNSSVRKKRRFTPGERPPAGAEKIESAQTLFEPVETKNGLSLVRAIPLTGRLHQIRATLFSLGFPMVGDKLYGLDETIYLKIRDQTLTAEDHRKLILKRQALHSHSLEFTHPITNHPHHRTSPVPFVI